MYIDSTVFAVEFIPPYLGQYLIPCHNDAFILEQDAQELELL